MTTARVAAKPAHTTNSRLVTFVIAFTLMISGLLVLQGPAMAEDAAAIEVGALTTNGRVKPLGIPGSDPAFGWASTSSRRGVTQSAYEIQVGTSAGESDVWSSGKVDSAKQVDVQYKGAALASATRYHWRVRVWDDKGAASDWSADAWFETGLLSAGDWGSAAWIGRPAPSYDGWTDYSATVKFKLNSIAFGTYLRAKDVNNAYMWQINVGTSASDIPKLVPHRKVNGNYTALTGVDLRPFGFTRDSLLAGTHTIAFDLSGTTIKTTLDDQVVDTRTMTDFSFGRAGLRTYGSESVTVSSFKVVKAGGTVLANPDFSTNPFDGGSLGDHQVTVSGGADALLSTRATEPYLRTSFSTESGKTVKSARAYASAHGVYELSLNGKKVGDQFLAPGYTEYDKRIQSQTYDVTDLVKDGDNGFGAAMGDGWWAGKIGLAGKAGYGTDLALVARLKITYTDGSTQWIDTDSSWKWGQSPFVATDNQLGETYDATLEQPGWDKAGFDDSDWSPVTVRTSDTAKLSPQPDEPVRETDVLDTKAVTSPKSWRQDLRPRPEHGRRGPGDHHRQGRGDDQAPSRRGAQPGRHDVHRQPSRGRRDRLLHVREGRHRHLPADLHAARVPLHRDLRPGDACRTQVTSTASSSARTCRAPAPSRPRTRCSTSC